MSDSLDWLLELEKPKAKVDTDMDVAYKLEI